MSEDWLVRARQRREQEQKQVSSEEDWLASARKRREQEQEPASAEEDWLVRAKQRRYDEDAQKVDDSYIDTFFNDAMDFLDGNAARYTGLNWGNASTTYQDVSASWTDLDYRRNVVQKWLELNKDYLDQTYFNDASEFLKTLDSDAQNHLSVFKNEKDYYSQWDTEEDYNAYIRNQEMLAADPDALRAELKDLEEQKAARIQAFDDADVVIGTEAGDLANQAFFKDLEKYDAQIAEKRQYLKQVLEVQRPVAENERYQQMLSADLNAVKYEIAELQAKRKGFVAEADFDWTDSGQRSEYNRVLDEMDNQIAQKQAYLRQASEAQEWTAANEEYQNLMTAEDFAEKSRYQSTANGKERTALQIMMDSYSAESSGWDDPLYEYINGNKEAGVYLSDMASTNYGPDNALGSFYGRSTENNAQSQQMEKDEVAIFNYIYATQGKEAAHDYYNFLQSDLNLRQRIQDEEYAREYAKDSPVLASAFSVLTSPLKGLSYVGQVSDYLDDGKFDQNAAYNKFSYNNSAIRGQVAKQIEESGKWGEVGSFAYQTGMSMGDFLMTTAVTGGNGTASMLIMGSGAAADTTIAAKDRGLSDEQAFQLGTVAGLAEALCERVSLGALLDGDLLRDSAGKYILKNMISEGLEEVTTSGVNLMADILIAKDQSEWQMSIDAYMKQGMTESEAFAQAMTDQALAMGLDFLGGAISGGVISSVGAGFNKLTDRSGGKQIDQGSAPVGAEGIQQRTDGVDVQQREDAPGPEAPVSLYDDAPAVQETAAEDPLWALAQEVAADQRDAENARQSDLEGAETATDAREDIRGVREQTQSEGIYEAVEDAPTVQGQQTAEAASDPVWEAAHTVVREARHQQEALAEEQAADLRPETAGKESPLFGRYTGKHRGPDESRYEKVRFEGEITRWGKKQRAEVEFVEFVAKNFSGNRVYVYESYMNADGKYVYTDSAGRVQKAHNGVYVEKNGDIYLDLNAGNHSEGLVLNTFAHELYHHVEKHAPDQAKALAEFIAKELGEENVEAAVNRQIEKARKAGYGEGFFEEQGMSAEEARQTVRYRAYSDFIADGLETMFTKGDVVHKLADLHRQDKGLSHTIRKFIRKWVSKLREFYNAGNTLSIEGRLVAELETFDEIQQMFAEALKIAGENYRTAEKNTAGGGGVDLLSLNDNSLTPGAEGAVVNQNGDPVAYATSDGTVMLSLRTYEEEGRDTFRKYLQKCVTSNKLTKAEMQEMLDGIEEIYGVCKEFKDKFAPFSAWSDASVVRDTHGRPVFSVVTPNGDYKMNLDFSLVCKKRRTLDAVFNEMSRRGIIDDFELGQKSVVKINEIIRKYGLETACALCFVDAKRFRQASMADSFTRLYNELVESLVPEEQKGSIGYFNFGGYSNVKKVEGGIDTWDNSKLDFSHLDYVMKHYGNGTVEHKAARYIKSHAEGRKLLLRGDFMSSQGFDAVKTQNKDILKLYNSKKGTGGPKAAFGDVQYMNEIIRKARTWTPAKAYAVGGVRIQSFSDYVPRMVFDYVQMVYDLAATKLPAHAYTKEALFVKQFGLTGIKINMSLIPAIAEGGIAPGLDTNGDYVWAGESFDYETAKQIQNAEGYAENCGTICVGVSYEHIKKLLNDPNIRMVIPYHKSGLNPIVAHMNKIAEFTDYTNDQRTKGKDGKALSKDFDFSKAMHDMGENASPKAVADQYLKWCVANGYTARFAEFAAEENYYKLLEDFTLYDKDGNYVPQRDVRAVFPKETDAFGSMKDLIHEGLEEDAIVEGKRDKNLSAIVDEIQRTLPKTEAEIAAEQVEQADRALFSERDTESVSNRSLLANALDSVAQDESEKRRLEEYREAIGKLEGYEKELAGYKEKLAALEGSKKPQDVKERRRLKDEAIKTANRIDIYDKKLLRLEGEKPLERVLKRERQRVLKEMQKKYGTIKHGEKAVRDDSLPVSTDGKNKVSLAARTVKGAGVTTDELADAIDAEVVQGGLTYIPLTNNKTTQKAREWLENEGWEDALREWHDDVIKCKSGADMFARGAVLLNNAAQAGNKKVWRDILYDYQFLNTTTAQGLQASRILKQLQPEDKLYMVRRSIKQMVKDMRLQVDIQLNEELVQAYQKAKTEEERDAIMAQIQQDVADQIPSTFMDKWTALRYVNMLGNLRTQGRNVIGNVAMMATTRFKDMVAVGLEQIAYKASGGKFNRTKALANNRELLKAAKNDFDTVESLVLDGGKYNDQRAQSAEFAKGVMEKQRIFKNKLLEGYRKLTNWAMDKGDVIFSKAAYGHALANYLQAHGVKTGDFSTVDPALLDDARVYAVQQAQEATFRDTNTLSGWVSTLGRKPTTPVVGRVLSEGTVPFRKTPANMLVRAEEYSPMGILNSLGISLHGAMGHSGLVNNKGFLGKIAKSGEQITGAQIVESWAKTITGTGLFALGMLLRNIGVLIGGPDDDEKLDKFEDLNGQQNYAFHIGDMYFTVDFLSPSVIPMFMGAQMLDLYQENGFQFKDLESAFTSLADPMVEMSMLQGLNDTLENVQYAENNLMQIAISASLSYLTQGLTNSMLGQIERGVEDSRRSTYVDKDGAVPGWLQSALGKASAKTPVWDYNQIPFINAWGEEEENPTVALNLIYNMLSPSYISKETKDTVSLELTRLNEVQSDVNVFPSTPEKEYDGRYLTAEEYVALARTQGQTQRQIIEKMVDSSLYDGLPDAYKAKAVSLAYQYAKESAQIEELGREGFSSDWMAEIKGNTAVGIVKHVIKENIKNMYLSGDISADEAVKRRIEYHGDTEDEAAGKVAYWDFQVKNPEYADWNESMVTRYKDLDPKTAAHVVDVLGKLEPEEGSSTVRTIQKMETITGDSKLSDEDKDIALRAIMDDKLEAKYDAAREMGIGSGQFALAYRKYQDTEGKGAKAAVVSYFKDTFKISDSEARELYDLFNGKEKE